MFPFNLNETNEKSYESLFLKNSKKSYYAYRQWLQWDVAGDLVIWVNIETMMLHMWNLGKIVYLWYLNLKKVIKNSKRKQMFKT